jgi:nucleotide-binding universal stress UspA family protein
MHEVLVAIDESAASKRVRDFVDDFFAGSDVSITVINVGTEPVAWGPHRTRPGPIKDGWERGAERFDTGVVSPEVPVYPDVRDHPKDIVASSGVAADDQVVTLGSDVAQALRRVAEQRGVELLVVGSNHRTVFERLLEPSVSRDLAKRSPCPVLIVH